MTLRPEYAQLITVLGDPTAACQMTDAQCSALVGTARSANLLGALAERLKGAGIFTISHAERHLDGARQLSDRQCRSVLWEVHRLQAVLGELHIPVLLLKGAAYVMAGHAVARGRLFGDIDILVPHAALAEVESRLMLSGWVSARTSTYDQRYYREWMHELPPMTHLRRGTVLDVHHTILPLTARHAPNAGSIIDRSSSLLDPELPALRIPCPEDLVIHSITHLVHEGELHNGLRDLWDIDCMLRSFGVVSGFWQRLIDYATDHDLVVPVCFGLRLVRQFFSTPIPTTVLTELSHDGQGPRDTRLLEAIYARALQPGNRPGLDVATRLAQWSVYVRSHSLRMPWLLLLRHLTIKAWLGWSAGMRDSERRM